MPPLAFSFSSSGLLFPYHLGAIEAILARGNLEVQEVHGVSGGALAGAVLLLGPESLERARAALRTRITPTWGELWDPAVLVPRLIREHEIFPSDAHARLSGKLFVYSSTGGMGKSARKHCQSTFSSNEDLLSWIQASCSFAWDGVRVGGEAHWDGCCYGGFAERSETVPTVAVAPVWTEDVEICPGPKFGFGVWKHRLDGPSFRGMWDCCFMFSPERMFGYWQRGRTDADAFFARPDAFARLNEVEGEHVASKI
mmetsp:Transcript_127116/g.406706  ORF Transcript_127116/g.406706 Transcript_127116/m.406706 type:complete len:255 (+) Transcript_127116:256-1020(+)